MVKILSYNIFYKTMISNPVHSACKLITNKSDPHIISYTNCLSNVSKMIESHGPYHFVCLQEASNWNIIRGITPTLKKMKYVSHKLDLDEIITFYDGSYQLDLSENILKGYMADINRPLLVLFFQNNLCVINLHAGHYTKSPSPDKRGKYYTKDIYFLDIYIKELLENNSNGEIYLEKFLTYDIIISGDFNDDLPNGLKIFNRKLYGINRVPTCCDNKLENRALKFSFDHILSTVQNNISTVVPVKLASDHIPIIATLSKNIGYDFDGVLHTNVTPPDRELQRHPRDLKGPYDAFVSIISQIKNEIEHGHNIYIITARKKTKSNLNAIQNHLGANNLDKYLDNINIYFSEGYDKTKLINSLKINTFYDDSCLRILELTESQLANHIPYLHQIYLVNPDNQTWKLVDTNNISTLCHISPEKEKNILCYQLFSLSKKLDIITAENRYMAINRCTYLIQQYIVDYQLKFSNPKIKLLLKKLKEDLANENLQIKIIKLVISDIYKNYLAQRKIE